METEAWYIRLLEAHPNCDWKIRPATSEDQPDNGQQVDFVLEIGGANMFLTTTEAVALLEWHSECEKKDK